MYANGHTQDDAIRRLILRTIERRPEDGFTATSLASSLGLPVTRVAFALDELTRSGLVLRDDDEYVSALQLD
jgi:DNA-binding IclR family transcriptional regulator